MKVLGHYVADFIRASEFPNGVTSLLFRQRNCEVLSTLDLEIYGISVNPNCKASVKCRFPLTRNRVAVQDRDVQGSQLRLLSLSFPRGILG